MGINVDYIEVGRQIALKWANHIEENFDSEGAASGEPWQPLAPITVEERGSAHPILHRTGRLRRSYKLDEPRIENNKLIIRVSFPQNLPTYDGDTAPIPAIHHYGLGVPKRKLFSEEKLREIAREVMMEMVGTDGGI